MRWYSFLSAIMLCSVALADKPITITLVHTNDLHAHIEPVRISKKAYGGYARQATIIKQIRATEKNVLLLNAGDSFQGTLFFNVYEGLADAACLNEMGYQAGTLGNHEFDRGPSVLSNYYQSVNFPIVSCNLDASQEPLLSSFVKPATIIQVGGEKFGIVGVTTPDTANISSPGPSLKFKDVVPSVQKTVDDLRKEGINKIILLSHVGFEEDCGYAKQLKGISLIVGGHSHTPLGTPDLPGWPKATAQYPTYVKDAEGTDVAVVQAWEWGKVIGHLNVSFDAQGKVKKIFNAKPIVVDESVPEDSVIKSMVTAFTKPIENLKNQVVGETLSPLTNKPEGSGEMLMADVISDGMLAATAKYGTVVAFVNSGGVRGSFEPGVITYGNAISVQPFSNTLVALDLTGEEIIKSLEQGASGTAGPTGGFLNPSKGFSYSVDYSKPVGSRVSAVTLNGEAISKDKTYTVALLSFTAGGGDFHDVIKNAKGKRVDSGLIDLDAFIEYLKAHKSINQTVEGRVKASRQ